MLSRKALCLLIVLATVIGACKKSVPASVAAMVNGRAITYADLDKQYKRQFPQQPEGTSADQVQIQKLELLRALIDEEILLQRAEKLSLIATEDEVTLRVNQLKAPYTQEEFQKNLDSQGMNLEGLKAQVRRTQSIDKLMNREIGNQINITDKDVSDFYNANQAAFRFQENKYHVAQIVVTSTPNPDVKNLSGSKAQNEEEARKKIQMIDQRLKQGEEFARVAQAFSEEPNSAPNGGDMGWIPESALQQVDPETRKAVLTLAPNSISAIIKIPNAWRIVKLISREPAGQRELTNPRVQQDIRDALRTRKEQLLRNAYLEVCRDESQVTNYLALSIAPGFEKK